MFVPKSFADKGVTCTATEVASLTQDKVEKFKETNGAVMSKPVTRRLKGEEVVTVGSFLDKLLSAATANGGQITVDNIKDASGMSQLLPNTGTSEFQSVIRLLMTKGYVVKGNNLTKSEESVAVVGDAF